MMKFFKVIVKFIVFSGLVCLTNGQSQDMQCFDLGKCVALLRALTSDENMAFAHTESELNTLCKKLKEAVTCVNTFIGRCLDHSSQVQYMAMTNGTQRIINELCTNGTTFREEYLRHAECYRKLSGEYKVCAEQYYANYEKIKDKTDDDDQETQIMKWCCNFDNHRACTYNSVSKKCGKDAASLAENIVITAGGVLVEIHCRNYTYNSPLCSSAITVQLNAATRHIMIPLLIIIMVFIWLL